jgi:uncharacterized protein (TIGR00369 family)
MKNPDLFAIQNAVKDKLQNVAMHTSPQLADLKCEIIDAKKGAIKLRFRTSDHHVQGANVVSGGTSATMLDYGLAFATLTTCEDDEACASISLTVNFLGAVQPGTVIVEAEVISSGYRVSQAQAKLLSEDGKVLATASSPLAMKRAKKS